jgi:hypothetical protein
MPQNMYNLLIQDVLDNREKYANANNSQPYSSHTYISHKRAGRGIPEYKSRCWTVIG